VVVLGLCGDGGDGCGEGVSRWGEMSITRAEKKIRLFGKRQWRPVAKGVGRIFGVERAAGRAFVTMCILFHPLLSLLVVGIILCRIGG